MVHKSFTLSNDANVYYLPSKVGRLARHGAMVDSPFPDHVYAHIVFKAWTPSDFISQFYFDSCLLVHLTATIVADFFIVAIDGTRLCTLTQVEVERHESSPSGGVARRHDVVFQPLAIPATAIQDQDTTILGHEDMRPVYTYLDHLATEAIAATLRKQPRTGTTVNFDSLIPDR